MANYKAIPRFLVFWWAVLFFVHPSLMLSAACMHVCSIVAHVILDVFSARRLGTCRQSITNIAKLGKAGKCFFTGHAFESTGH
jgi:hypothetical protein